jgi:peptidoglycan/LPS O-acetylase OafA/YrhL
VRRGHGWAAPVALVYLLVFVVLDLQRGLFVGPLLVAGFCAAALVVALDDESPISRALALRPFTFLGRISYSLYLWHVPVLAAFGVTHPQVGLVVPPAIAAAVACATASHYLVERPFLRRRQRLERRAAAHACEARARVEHAADRLLDARRGGRVAPQPVSRLFHPSTGA